MRNFQREKVKIIWIYRKSQLSLQRSKFNIYVAVVSVRNVAIGLFLCPLAIYSGVCKSRDTPIIGASSHVDKTLNSGQVATPLYLLTQARATLFKKLQIMLNNKDSIVLSKSSTGEDLKRYFTANRPLAGFLYPLRYSYRHCTPVVLLNGIPTALGVLRNGKGNAVFYCLQIFQKCVI